MIDFLSLPAWGHALKYRVPQSHIASITGSRVLPASDNEYSTLGGNFGADPSFNYAIRFEFMKLHRQHPLCDIGEERLELSETFVP